MAAAAFTPNGVAAPGFAPDQKIPGAESAARGSIAACNRPISAPYDMHRRAQGVREPLRSDGKDDRAEYEHDLSPNI